MNRSRADLTLDPRLRGALLDHAQDAAPREACGLLVGTRAEDGARVLEVTRGDNLAPAPARDRFVLDPLHLMAVEDDARARGLEVLGAWHSHPRGPALPSEADREAAWVGWSYVIVGEGDLRSWTLRGDDLVEEAVES